MIPRLNFEGLLPLQLVAALLWFCNIVGNCTVMIIATGVMFGLSQLMIIPGVLDQPRAVRVAYVCLNELYAASGFLLIFYLQLLSHR